MSEQNSFLAAIQEDRYDQALRLVYADWLEEHGLDDEALEQRAWTPRKQEADDWLRDFATKVDIPYEDVIQAGHGWVKNGDYFVESGQLDASNAMYEAEIRDAFWQHWEALTGVTLSEEKWEAIRAEEPPFICSC